MKIVFSTKNVNRGSFLDICRYTYDYGFAGFEIYDAIKERKAHHDSILRRDRVADAKRKLVNRNIAVSALRMPFPVESEETTSDIITNIEDINLIPDVIIDFSVPVSTFNISPGCRINSIASPSTSKNNLPEPNAC